ncbi:MaoC family dehydratase [Myxococcota bacterium]|nr:MaoC family dehydratase [Myxococcota bacterium]MBU1432824.1 MaoC family dehydratase [Myxococcota bacterium]MBU1897550.1 MaoC family dehydratase [Myxococcota bacterium]
MTGKTIHELEVGQEASFSKTLTESDVYLFAGVTGDLNPAHIDEVYASNTFFKTRIVHGMLLGGMISAVLGSKLPGPGTIYVKQDLRFKAPVRIGDTVTAKAIVKSLDLEKNRVVLETVCVNQDGLLVLVGEALVSPRVSKG